MRHLEANRKARESTNLQGSTESLGWNRETPLKGKSKAFQEGKFYNVDLIDIVLCQTLVAEQGVACQDICTLTFVTKTKSHWDCSS